PDGARIPLTVLGVQGALQGLEENLAVSPEEERQGGLTRERLVEAALGLINEEGLEGLSMRALADRLEVKAASLHWHVRDRHELLALHADSFLAWVGRPRRGAG